MTMQFRMPLTMADAIAAIEQDAALSDARRRTLLSDVRTFCRWLDTPPKDVACMPNWLRSPMADLHHRRLGVSKRRISNVRSSVNAAMDYVGKGTAFVAAHVDVPPAWQTVLALSAGTHMHPPLRALAAWCAFRGLSPADVTEAVFADWLAFRTSDPRCRAKKPGHQVMKARSSWNRACGLFAGWPGRPVRKPKNPRLICVPFAAWPASLQEEWAVYARAAAAAAEGPGGSDASFEAERAAWLRDESIAGDESAFDRGALEVGTLKGHKEVLLQAYTAVVETGLLAAQDVTLTKLATPFVAKVLVRWLGQRRIAPSERQITYVKRLRTIRGRLGQDLSDETAAFQRIIKDFITATGVKPKMMTRKNRRWLAQFNDPTVLREFVSWPQTVMEELEAERRRTGSVRPEMARRAEDAIAHMILCSLPLRAANLRTLRLEAHFFMPVRKNSPGQLFIPAQEVKNDRPAAAELNPNKIRLLRLFLSVYRPVLVGGRKSPFLFPSRSGDGYFTGFAKRLPDRIWRELGLKVSLHFYRHLMATTLLKARPGEYRSVEALLAQVPGSGATQVYAEYQTDYACKMLDQILSEMDSRHGAR